MLALAGGASVGPQWGEGTRSTLSVLALLVQVVQNTAAASDDTARTLFSAGVLSGAALPLLLSLMLRPRERFATMTPTAAAADVSVELRPDEYCAQLLHFASKTPAGAKALHAALPMYRQTLLIWLFETLAACEFQNRSMSLSLLSKLLGRQLDYNIKTTGRATCDEDDDEVSKLLCGALAPILHRMVTDIAPHELTRWLASGGNCAMLCAEECDDAASEFELRDAMPCVFALACCAARARPAALIARLLAASAGASAKSVSQAEVLREVVAAWQTRRFLAPAATSLHDASPMSDATARENERAHASAQRKVARASDARHCTPLQDGAHRGAAAAGAAGAAGAAASPLLRAARTSGVPRRERTALLRAHIVHTRSALERVTEASILRDWESIAAAGYMRARLMETVGAGSAAANSFSAGVFFMTGGPEVVVLGDLPQHRVHADVQEKLCHQLCSAAADKILACVEQEGDTAAAEMATQGFELPEREVGLVAWAFRELGGGEASGGGASSAASLPPGQVAAAAAKLVWRLHPTAGVGRSAEARATLAAAGGDLSRFANCIKRAPFYRDVAGIDSAEAPTLLCSLSRTLAAASADGAAVLNALARLAALDRDRAQAGAGDNCAGCPICVARRAAGTLCALPACTQRGSCRGPLSRGPLVKLKVCSGCGRAAYCSRACQKADWPRHKPECQPKPAAV